MDKKPIRVLIVDDSVVVRQLISDALRSDPEIEIAGMAANGRLALEQLEKLEVDLILLDLEMPEMDGLTLLDTLKQRGIRLPVVVFSSMTERGASATMEALTRGASDYVPKPSGQKNMNATLTRIREELIPRVHALGARARAPIAPPVPARSPSSSATMRRVDARPPGERPKVIVIGVSTGGPNALSEIVLALPADFSVPVLIVQHMPPVFTKALAARLAQGARIAVCEATHQQPLQAGTAYLAPGDHHMRIAGGVREPWIALGQEAKENGCRPAVDPLFRSAAATFGVQVLALVLTGVGSDGARGAAEVRKAGGQVWVQDRQSCAAGGMPSAVVDAGLCDRELPLAKIGSALVAAVGGGDGQKSPERKVVV
jgi:two-component system, chemotaxis family, protein-glutamate methylesterase/glutaminase